MAQAPRTVLNTPLGFTLLEVLVVVVLVALVSAVLVPATLNVDARQQASAVDTLETLLQDLSESALYTGQVTALRVNDDSYKPLFFNADDLEFQLFAGKKTTQLPAGLTLEWQPESAENFSTGVNDGIQAQRDSQKKHQNNRDDDLPQIYFLPGGQTTAGLITLEAEDGDKFYLRLDAMGRVTHGEKAQRQRPGEVPDLILPDDSLSYE